MPSMVFSQGEDFSELCYVRLQRDLVSATELRRGAEVEVTPTRLFRGVWMCNRRTRDLYRALR